MISVSIRCEKCGAALQSHLGSDLHGRHVLDVWPCAECARVMVRESLDSEVVVERLADYAHRAWSGWMRHMLKHWDRLHVSGWRRQMATDYSDLSADEQASDIRQAKEIVAILHGLLGKVDA